MTRIRMLAQLAVGAAALLAVSCSKSPPALVAAAGEIAAEDRIALPPPEIGLPPNPMTAPEITKEEIIVPPPPFSEGIFPCSDCHADQETNPTPREMKEKHRKIKLHHDEENRWCLDCHDADNRDQLHLASGKPVPFEKSYLLCGQCHGEKLRDWKAGIHGKRTGMWNGTKEYLLCAHCHDPHSPRFKPLAPEPPPLRPTEIR